MKPIELAASLKASRPELFGNIPTKRLARMITAAMAEIRTEIDATKEGVVRVGGLGRFVVRGVPAKEEGAAPRRRIRFRPARPRSGKQKGRGPLTPSNSSPPTAKS
jgi:hypothetical protein